MGFKFTYDQQWKKQEETDVDILEMEEESHQIVIYNDDVNTFDYVILSLMELCGHTPEQAEQCTILIHYKGKCGVKTGALEELIPICSALLDRGLSAEIE